LAADTPSQAADHARFVSITRQLEAAPLQESLHADRAWAMRWLAETHDVSVTICYALSGMGDDYRYGNELLAQYAFAMGALIIEHPEAASNGEAQQLVGAEGVLKAYSAILKEKPDAKSANLERLRDFQARGELPMFVSKAYASCLEDARRAPAKG